MKNDIEFSAHSKFSTLTLINYDTKSIHYFGT